MFVCSECGLSYPAPGFCTEDGGALSDASADPMLGRAVGSYRVATKIGEGGMGVVYKAVHPTIGSRVAVKMLSPECAKSPVLVERFFAEARAVNLIRHDNIVSVLDLSSLPDGRPYIVMEYLEGAALSSVLSRAGALPLGTLCRLMKELLDALGVAHQKGIVHRDLKPDNVFVSTSGRLKVLDFGIAKLRPELGGIGDATRTGSLMGTPHYMSPEQAAGRAVDQRSDLYSAGVILFEGATGQRPFVVDTLYDLLRAHVELMPTAPSLLRADIPPLLEQVLLTALQKDPQYRFQSAAEFVQAIDRASESLPPDSFVPIASLSSFEGRRGAISNVGSGAAARPPTPMALTPPTLGSPDFPSPPPKKEGSGKGKLGYFALGTCGVITLATLGSCVTCVYIGANAEKPTINVPLGNGEVAVYTPKEFEPTAFLGRATSIAVQKDATAKLVSVKALGKWTSKAADLTETPADRATYTYRTKEGCLAVEVTATGLTTAPLPTCSGSEVSPPTCTIEDVWERVQGAGGPLGWKHGSLTYSAGSASSGIWHAAVEGYSGNVPDGCP